MTTWNLLYLIMCIGTFAIFGAVLAYESWRGSRMGPEMIEEPEAEAHHDQALAA